MGRAYTAWWLKYPGREVRAVKLLAKFRPAVEKQIKYWESSCFGEVDWEPVFWDAAYRAAWRCDGKNFWPLLRVAMRNAGRKYLATHKRRTSKLRRVGLNPTEFDEALNEDEIHGN